MNKRVKAEMMKTVQGWGVWLETVEITSCMIKDQKTFEDL